jgi:hypothetical protein
LYAFIDDLSASDCEKDKFKVCALVLCVIFNNRFKEEYLTTKDKEIQQIIKKTLSQCKLNKYSSFHDCFFGIKHTTVEKIRIPLKNHLLHQLFLRNILVLN